MTWKIYPHSPFVRYRWQPCRAISIAPLLSAPAAATTPRRTHRVKSSAQTSFLKSQSEAQRRTGNRKEIDRPRLNPLAWRNSSFRSILLKRTVAGIFFTSLLVDPMCRDSASLPFPGFVKYDPPLAYQFGLSQFSKPGNAGTAI